MRQLPSPIPDSWSNRCYGVAARESEVAHRGSIVAGSDCGVIGPLAENAVHVSEGFHKRMCERCRHNLNPTGRNS